MSRHRFDLIQFNCLGSVLLIFTKCLLSLAKYGIMRVSRGGLYKNRRMIKKKMDEVCTMNNDGSGIWMQGRTKPRRLCSAEGDGSRRKKWRKSCGQLLMLMGSVAFWCLFIVSLFPVALFHF